MQKIVYRSNDKRVILAFLAFFAFVFCAMLAIWIAFYGTIGYVIWHFLQKVW